MRNAVLGVIWSSFQAGDALLAPALGVPSRRCARSRTSRQAVSSVTPETSMTCPVLGDLSPIGQDSSDSFVASMGVPTYAASGIAPMDDHDETIVRHELTPIPGAFWLENFLAKDVCAQMITTCEELGFGIFNSGKNHHGALQVVVESAEGLAERARPFIDLEVVESIREEMMPGSSSGSPLRMVGWNRRWRIYRYEAGGQQQFKPHIDAGFPPSGIVNNQLVWDLSDGTVVSRLTVLLYLNGDFVGGETNFYAPRSENELLASMTPRAGSCLIFPQGVGEEAVEYARQNWPLHEGSPVIDGSPKYVIRSDVLFTEEEG